MRSLFEGGAYSSNYCNWQLKSLLHLGQIVITFRTLLQLNREYFMESALYGIYARVVDVSEIERVSAANE